MMKWFESRVLWGTLLILGGILFLLQNLGMIAFGDLFWALLFALGGLFFLSIFLQNRANWWSLIPGFTLFGIALTIFFSTILPRFSAVWGGAFVLGGIGLSFVVIFLVQRQHWWAVIPAGVLLTLALISAVSEVLPGLETGGLLFLGMGLTFAVIALLPGGETRMVWAWIPAGILLLMGLLLFAASANLINLILPLALVVGGLFLLLRAFLPRLRS